MEKGNNDDDEDILLGAVKGKIVVIRNSLTLSVDDVQCQGVIGKLTLCRESSYVDTRATADR